jgi:hypothetical protein
VASNPLTCCTMPHTMVHFLLTEFAEMPPLRYCTQYYKGGERQNFIMLGGRMSRARQPALFAAAWNQVPGVAPDYLSLTA